MLVIFWHVLGHVWGFSWWSLGVVGVTWRSSVGNQLSILKGFRMLLIDICWDPSGSHLRPLFNIFESFGIPETWQEGGMGGGIQTDVLFATLKVECWIQGWNVEMLKNINVEMLRSCIIRKILKCWHLEILKILEHLQILKCWNVVSWNVEIVK